MREPGGSFWQKVAIGACSVLTALALGWTASTSEELDAVKDRVRDGEENTRNHDVALKNILRVVTSINAKLGGDPIVPPMRPMRSSSEIITMKRER